MWVALGDFVESVDIFYVVAFSCLTIIVLLKIKLF